jgi:triacylglycerol lipase
MGIRPVLGGATGAVGRRVGALSPRRRRFVFAATAGVVVLVGALAGPPLVSRLTAPAAPTGYPSQERLGTVLLVPGYGGGTSALDVLAARLRTAGRDVTVVQLPDGGTGDLSVAATVLDGDVSSALRSAPSVDVVGYSAGGVVTRLWVEQHDGAAKARRVVTLGSPFAGTSVASAGAAADPNDCPVACQQLVPGSSLLTQLAAAAPVAGHPPWLSVWTTQDQTVVPPTSASLAGATDLAVQTLCPGEQVSHSQLPTDPAVMGMVLWALGTGAIGNVTSLSCTSLRAAGNG